MEKVAIIILNWNGLALTTKCLEGLLSNHVSADLYILDNGSQENEAANLRTRFPTVHVERSETNLGFTGGNNYWLKQLSGQYPYIILLNQDTEITGDIVSPLLAAMEADPLLAACGPTGAAISLWTGKVKRDAGSDCVVGYCVMLRSSVLQAIGELTEQYFAYYEEADWCLQAKQAGYHIQVVPLNSIQHLQNHQFRTYYIARNMVWFMKRFANPLQLTYFFCYYFTIFWVERIRKGSTFRDLLRAAQAGWYHSLPKRN